MSYYEFDPETRAELRRYRLLVAIAAAVVLAAVLCERAQAGVPQQTRILAWGDSLTAGMDWGVWVETWYPNYDVIDYGWNGEQSWRAACGLHTLGLDCRFRNFLQGYASQPGDIFVFLWGTNDVRYAHWEDYHLNVPTSETTEAALQQLVDDALATGAEVVIGVPPPMVWTEASPHTPQEIDTYNERIATQYRGFVTQIVGSRQGVKMFDAYEMWQGLPGFPDASYYAPDGFHPGTLSTTPSGHSGNWHVAEAVESGLAYPVPVPPWILPSLGLSIVLAAHLLLAGKGTTL